MYSYRPTLLVNVYKIEKSDELNRSDMELLEQRVLVASVARVYVVTMRAFPNGRALALGNFFNECRRVSHQSESDLRINYYVSGGRKNPKNISSDFYRNQSAFFINNYIFGSNCLIIL